MNNVPTEISHLVSAILGRTSQAKPTRKPTNLLWLCRTCSLVTYRMFQKDWIFTTSRLTSSKLKTCLLKTMWWLSEDRGRKPPLRKWLSEPSFPLHTRVRERAPSDWTYRTSWPTRRFSFSTSRTTCLAQWKRRLLQSLWWPPNTLRQKSINFSLVISVLKLGILKFSTPSTQMIRKAVVLPLSPWPRSNRMSTMY